jgi:hypothetical protein
MFNLRPVHRIFFVCEPVKASFKNRLATRDKVNETELDYKCSICYEKWTGNPFFFESESSPVCWIYIDTISIELSLCLITKHYAMKTLI